MIDLSCIRNADPELCAAMEQELARQRGNLELIAITATCSRTAARRPTLPSISRC